MKGEDSAKPIFEHKKHLQNVLTLLQQSELKIKNAPLSKITWNII